MPKARGLIGYPAPSSLVHKVYAYTAAPSQIPQGRKVSMALCIPGPSARPAASNARPLKLVRQRRFWTPFTVFETLPKPSNNPQDAIA